MFDTAAIETMPARIIAGLSRRYDEETRQAIPGQWGDLMAMGEIPGAVPGAWYGVCSNFGANMSFDYLCGQEVRAPAAGFATIDIPAGAYARFASKAHISRMQAGYDAVYGDWLKRPGYRPRPGPTLEFYPPEFNGMTGEGGWEIWVPLEG